jgi:hypothetical protein
VPARVQDKINSSAGYPWQCSKRFDRCWVSCFQAARIREPIKSDAKRFHIGYPCSIFRRDRIWREYYRQNLQDLRWSESEQMQASLLVEVLEREWSTKFSVNYRSNSLRPWRVRKAIADSIITSNISPMFNKNIQLLAWIHYQIVGRESCAFLLTWKLDPMFVRLEAFAFWEIDENVF